MNFFKRFLSLFASASNQETVDEEIERLLKQKSVKVKDNKGRYVPHNPDTVHNKAYIVKKKN